jgi:hypothetical protein
MTFWYFGIRGISHSYREEQGNIPRLIDTWTDSTRFSCAVLKRGGDGVGEFNEVQTEKGCGALYQVARGKREKKCAQMRLSIFRQRSPRQNKKDRSDDLSRPESTRRIEKRPDTKEEEEEEGGGGLPTPFFLLNVKEHSPII